MREKDSEQRPQQCQRCSKPKSEHGPRLQCPCVIYTHEGNFVKWNPCKFLGLSEAEPSYDDAIADCEVNVTAQEWLHQEYPAVMEAFNALGVSTWEIADLCVEFAQHLSSKRGT